MDIDDKTLITNALKTTGVNSFLHMDTIKILNDIHRDLTNGSTSFRNQDVTQKILNAWVSILQDSILNLKSCDYREHAHWHLDAKKTREDERDINNQFVFGLDRIREYFQEFTEFEGVLYGVDGGYRDHVIHVFRVWLLGVVILYTDPSLGMTITDLEIPALLPDINVFIEEELFSMWAIIALCHDLGYPLEKAEQINDAVEKMYRHLGKMNIQKFSAAFHLEHQFINKFLLDFISSKITHDPDDITELTSEKVKNYLDSKKPNNSPEFENKLFYTSIQSKYFLKFAKSLEYYSHGIISCTILLKSLFFFLESDFNMQESNALSFEDARQFSIRREILRSIAAHTCPEVYHLKPNTLSFFLILCDELQEWDRPSFPEMIVEGNRQRKISINTFSKELIDFSLEYTSPMDSDKYAQKVFRKWHTILRSAVDDASRKFELNFMLKINKTEYGFKFTDNNLKATKRKDGGNTERFNIYQLLND